MTSEFPDDLTGKVLRGLVDAGDDLAKVRPVDFAAVFPDRESAEQFAAHFQELGLQADLEETGCVEELPWDVSLTKEMAPSRTSIVVFEADVSRVAAQFGGRGDGWGCFAAS